MLLGHWYLVTPSLSFRPLRLSIYAVFAAVAVDFAVIAYGLASHGNSRERFISGDQAVLFWLLVVGAGVLFTAAVNAFTLYFARIRANQPATAMLYVLIIKRGHGHGADAPAVSADGSAALATSSGTAGIATPAQLAAVGVAAKSPLATSPLSGCCRIRCRRDACHPRPPWYLQAAEAGALPPCLQSKAFTCLRRLCRLRRLRWC